MSGCELVEVRNVADAVGLVLSKRSDTMRRQARKRYLQVVERIGGPGRDRTDDLFHAMEARSQLRHRPTWLKGEIFPKLLFTDWKAVVKPNNRRPPSIPFGDFC